MTPQRQGVRCPSAPTNLGPHKREGAGHAYFARLRPLGLWLLLLGVPLAGNAASLPPLRVDPALLGGGGRPLAPAASVRESTAAAPGKSAGSGPTTAPTTGQAAAVSPRAEAVSSAEPARGAAAAGAAEATPMPLPPTTPFVAADKRDAPTQVSADRIEGVNDLEVVAVGEAVLERGGDTLRADRIVYRQIEDEVEAIGNVRLSSAATAVRGPRLTLGLSTGIGEFEQPTYTIRRQPPPLPEPALTILGLPAMNEQGAVIATTGRLIPRPPVVGQGRADTLEFRGEDLYHLKNATFSTCQGDKPDWEIRVRELDLDYLSEEGRARSATVTFLDVPILHLPWMSFPLNNQRKSGFLPPTIGSTSKSGLELTAPWYWNIAPQMDATLAPRLMTKRGLQLNGELRYLLDTPVNRSQPGYPDKGQLRLELLPNDAVSDRSRWGYAWQHQQSLGPGLMAMLNLNGVSDPDYFSDLSTRVAQVSQGNLLRQGMLTYAGPWYGAVLNVQTYQTLGDIVSPYRRLPQLTATAFRYDLPAGLALHLNAEFVNFDHPDYLLGRRSIVYPQLSWPLASAAFSLTPKLGVHATHYALSRLSRPAPNQIDLPPAATENRLVPIFSLDGGLVLERDLDWFGQSLLQTLEPRAYYLFVPRRDQRRLPIFDTGITGFNYAQLFSENRYAGGDRIGDANDLTLALSSRLIDPKSGAELLRATLATRYYFTDQHVTLPTETARSERKADLLATLVGQLYRHVFADLGWQYNPRDARTERLTLTGRYRPGPGRVFNAGYRYARDLLGQIDVSAQWPLAGGWHGVGRYNYSTKERRIIETIGGLEYDAGCWISRFVVQRLATLAERPTTALFFQLELKDFSRIGSNPMQLLRRSIPGYGVINQPTADPVFAEF